MSGLYPNLNPKSTECSMLVMGIKSIGDVRKSIRQARACVPRRTGFWLLPGMMRHAYALFAARQSHQQTPFESGSLHPVTMTLSVGERGPGEQRDKECS